MKYVQVDEDTGSVTWDAYFEYLRSAQGDFPADLYSYVVDWNHYSIDGADSLHDGWLLAVQFSYRKKDLIIEILGARHDRKHSFTYMNVSCYEIDLDVRFSQGDRDVLAHEFRAERGGIVHEIVFANRKGISIFATDIVPRTELLS